MMVISVSVVSRTPWMSSLMASALTSQARIIAPTNARSFCRPGKFGPTQVRPANTVRGDSGHVWGRDPLVTVRLWRRSPRINHPAGNHIGQNKPKADRVQRVALCDVLMAAIDSACSPRTADPDIGINQRGLHPYTHLR